MPSMPVLVSACGTLGQKTEVRWIWTLSSYIFGRMFLDFETANKLRYSRTSHKFIISYDLWSNFYSLARHSEMNHLVWSVMMRTKVNEKRQNVHAPAVKRRTKTHVHSRSVAQVNRNWIMWWWTYERFYVIVIHLSCSCFAKSGDFDFGSGRVGLVHAWTDGR